MVNSPHRLEVSQSLHESLLSDVPGKTTQEHLGREATARVQTARWQCTTPAERITTIPSRRYNTTYISPDNVTYDMYIIHLVLNLQLRGNLYRWYSLIRTYVKGGNHRK